MPRPYPAVAPSRLDKSAAAVAPTPPTAQTRGPQRGLGGSKEGKSVTKSHGSCKTPPTSPSRAMQPIRTEWLVSACLVSVSVSLTPPSSSPFLCTDRSVSQEDLPLSSPRTEDAQASKCHVGDVARSRLSVPPLVVLPKAGNSPVTAPASLDDSSDKRFYNFYFTPSPQTHTYDFGDFRKRMDDKQRELSGADGDPSDTDGMPLTTRSALCSNHLVVDDKERLLLESPRSLMLAAEVKSPAQRLRANLSACLGRQRESPREGPCLDAIMIRSGKTNADLHHHCASKRDKIDQTRDHATESKGASQSAGRELQLERALRAEKMRSEALSRKVAMYEAQAPLLCLCMTSLAILCVKRAEFSS